MATKQDYGLAVLEWLVVGPQRLDQLVTMTQLKPSQVRQGIAWIRDYDPNCLIVQRSGMQHTYKLAEQAMEVKDYQNGRSKTLFRQAVRLEKMAKNAMAEWPDDLTIKIMELHLRHMREQIEVFRDTTE